MSSSVTGLILPFDPSNTQRAASVEKYWSLANLEVAKANATRVIYEANGPISLVSLGKEFSQKTVNERNESYKQAVASGLNRLLDADIKNIAVDVTAHPHAAAVGSHLASFSFTLKTGKKGEVPRPTIQPSSDLKGAERKEWDRGVIYAQAQNLARELKELPANLCTPTIFAKRIQKEFSEVPDTQVIVRDKEWVTEQGMRTFLSVAQGSSEPLKFVEIRYNGAPKEHTPLVFVGKGITFDTGGIALKPPVGMKAMRADMGGAACVSSATLAIAKLRLPINVVTCIPLTENMPGPSATKPGDIIYAMNGKSVEVENPDAEGRLVLADALHYANITFKPSTIINVATLTGAMGISLGQIFSGVFTNSDELWSELNAAGEAEFDRLWRMPLDEEFGPQIYSSNADLCNRGGPQGGSCTAALFLKAFVEGVDAKSPEKFVRWAHIDIAGTMDVTREGPYQKKGMTGRSTRALIEFARRSCVEVA